MIIFFRVFQESQCIFTRPDIQPNPHNYGVLPPVFRVQLSKIVNITLYTTQ